MNVIIDAKKACTLKNNLWRGYGMVSANNSSRLLLDYKILFPEIYNEILLHIFSDKGLNVQHLKIEMGADINSSSGTEPCTMRTEDEECNVKRGAGFVLAADAKKINPDITLDMLWWSEPAWIEKSSNLYGARYKWYKENLCSAYKTFGLKFDFVSATQNERAWDPAWIKYLRKALDAEKNAPYDFSKIKIVAGEEVCTWNIADLMLEDEKLMKAVDVAGSHYTSLSTDQAQKLLDYGKELWFSESSSSMGDAKGICRFEESHSGIDQMNGVLDIATRTISMYPGGKMTLEEFQPVVSAYYDGVSYCAKQLILANSPWNGHYFLDAGYYMSLHFTRFVKKGWSLIPSACNQDGKIGGDGHTIVDAQYSFITALSPDKKDFTFIATNTTDQKKEYTFSLENINLKNDFLNVWQTMGPGTEFPNAPFDKNYFKKVDCIKIVKNKFSFTLQPFSLVTITSLEDSGQILPYTKKANSLMPLPYKDDFSYSSYDKDFLKDRAGTPLFTTDMGGAFEVVNVDGKNLLQQKVELKNKAKEWGWTSEPVTNFGDDRWFNYSAQVKILFAKDNGDEKNPVYAGLGLRYNLGDQGHSGWWLKLYKNDKWSLCKNKEEILSGKISVKKDDFNLLKISAFEEKITLWVNGEKICDTSAQLLKTAIPSAGRAALYSSWDKNYFSDIHLDLAMEAKEKNTSYFIERFDDTATIFDYDKNARHTLMASFKQHNRTFTRIEAKEKFSLTFKGKSFSITGKCSNDCHLKIYFADGKIIEEDFCCPQAGDREIIYQSKEMAACHEKIYIELLQGFVEVDTAEILS